MFLFEFSLFVKQLLLASLFIRQLRIFIPQPAFCVLNDGFQTDPFIFQGTERSPRDNHLVQLTADREQLAILFFDHFRVCQLRAERFQFSAADSQITLL